MIVIRCHCVAKIHNGDNNGGDDDDDHEDDADAMIRF